MNNHLRIQTRVAIVLVALAFISLLSLGRWRSLHAGDAPTPDDRQRAGAASPAPVHAGQTGGPFTMKRRVTREVAARYLAYLPRDYRADDSKRRPMILFLHGAGERGTDAGKIDRLGPLGYASSHEAFPFIVVAPQCPLNADWSPDELNVLLDEILERYRVDPDRVYLTGYSMGGWGTWELAMETPDRFAAIAPLCGRVVPLMCGRLWKMPVWAFHGDKDDVVPFAHSQEIVGYLRGMGNDKVKFTVYEDAGHSIWDRTYAKPELYAWFLNHRVSDRHPPASTPAD